MNGPSCFSFRYTVGWLVTGRVPSRLLRSSCEDLDLYSSSSTPVRVLEEYDYRNARGILHSRAPEILDEMHRLLNNEQFHLRLGAAVGKSQNLSRQLQTYFVSYGWELERPVFVLPDLRYDLLKSDVPIEIEIGHERLVYAVFFKFLADYSQRKIPAGVMVVTQNPKDFGHNWHNSLESTRRKIEAISSALLVPILVLGLQP